MKIIYEILAAILLLFNGIGAIYGGSSFILHPDGSGLKMTTGWLNNSPFTDYLIPGIILFIANGLFSLFTLVMMFSGNRRYPFFVMAQGVILTGWIVIQILLVQRVYYLHFVLGSIGIALVILGLLMNLATVRSGKS